MIEVDEGLVRLCTGFAPKCRNEKHLHFVSRHFVSTGGSGSLLHPKYLYCFAAERAIGNRDDFQHGAPNCSANDLRIPR